MCWSPLFPLPPTVDLPTQASRGSAAWRRKTSTHWTRLTYQMYAVSKQTLTYISITHSCVLKVDLRCSYLFYLLKNSIRHIHESNNKIIMEVIDRHSLWLKYIVGLTTVYFFLNVFLSPSFAYCRRAAYTAGAGGGKARALSQEIHTKLARWQNRR